MIPLKKDYIDFIYGFYWFDFCRYCDNKKIYKTKTLEDIRFNLNKEHKFYISNLIDFIKSRIINDLKLINEEVNK